MIKVLIEVNSKADLPLSEAIVEALDKLGVQSIVRVISAHKAPQYYEAIKEHEGNDTYSGLVSIQRRVRQYLNMADERKEGDLQSGLHD